MILAFPSDREDPQLLADPLDPKQGHRSFKYVNSIHFNILYASGSQLQSLHILYVSLI